MDSFLIVQEIVLSLLTRQKECLILKLDFEKAFDSVDWPFHFEILEAFGFGSKWIGWIQSILESTCMHVCSCEW